MTGNKFLIGLVITAILLASVPAASAEEYTLGIFGNANGDDTINPDDMEYTLNIILGLNNQTEFADSKYDNEINILDLTQIELVILGKEKELTLLDSQDKIVTVNKPIDRIITTWRGSLEMLRTIGVTSDKIVGVETLGEGTRYYKTFFPEYRDKPRVGIIRSPDIEKILSLDPDCIFFLFPFLYGTAGEEFKSAGIPVIHCFGGIWDKDVSREIKTFGYIFNKRDRAEEYIKWREEILKL